MKNFTFLTDLRNSERVMSRLRLGNNQVKTTWRFIAILTMLITLGVGNVWGANKTYTKITSTSSLSSGDKCLIVCEGQTNNSGDIRVFKASAASSGAAAESEYISMSNSSITCNENYAFTLTSANGTDWKITGTNGSIGHLSGNNTLGVNTTITNTISFSDGNAVIGCDSRVLRCNANSGSPLFRYYSNTQQAVQLYKEVASSTPSLSISDNATSLAMGDAKVNGSGVSNNTLTFSGSNLTANATLSISGTNAAMFSVSPTSVSKGSGTITNQTFTVTYTPTSAGSHSATLTISSTGATSKEITLTGTGKYEVTWKCDGSIDVTTLVASGSRPTFPSTPTSCDTGEGASTTFVGWTKTTWSGKKDKSYVDGLTTDATKVHTSNSTMSTITANGTIYYAVFCKGSGGSVTLTGSDFAGALGASYSTATITKTIGVTEYEFELQACEPGNNTSICQMRDNSTLSYIAIPTLPGVITGLSSTTVSDASGNAYSSVLHFKHTKTRGNANTNDIAKLDCSSSTITSLNWDLSSNTTYSAGYLLTSGGLRLSNLTIYYGGSGTNYMTNCCTALGTINGSISWSNAATAVVSWDNLDHVSSWTVKYKTHAAGAYTTWAGDQSTAAGRRSVTITGLTPCTNYDFQIIANPASGYCDKDQTIEDSQTHNWTVTKTGVTNVTAASLSAIPATTCASGFGPITITAADGYNLPSTITVTNASSSWNQATGALSISSVTGNVSITITPTAGSTWKFKYSGDSYTEHTMTEDAGVASYSISLAADTRFNFCIDDNGTAYKNNGTIITTTSGWVFNTTDGNCNIHTGPAGTYTFAINTTTKAVTVTYPDVTHPNDHYVYFKNSDVWGTVYGYLYNTGNDNKAANWPGSVMAATTTICGETYHYAALNAMSGTYNSIKFNDGGSGYGHETSALSTTSSLGKFNANRDANWHAFKYTISFNGNGNTSGSMSDINNICIGSNQALTSNAFAKTYYTFAGWHADVDVKVGESTISAGDMISNGVTIKDIQSNIALEAQWSVIPVTALTLNYSTLKKYVGESSVTLSVASVTPGSANPAVTWTSSDATVASVDGGVVSFLKAGTATITATSTVSGGVTATCSVEVRSISSPTMQDEDGTPISGSGLSATWTLNTRTLAASEGTSKYKFKRWIVTNATPASTTNLSTTLGDPTGNVTVVAEFYKPRTVTKGTGTGTSTFTVSPTGEVKYGSSVTVTCAATDGYKNPWTLTVTPSDGATYSSSGSAGSITISNITKNITVDLAYTAKSTATLKIEVAGSESTIPGTRYEGDSYTLPSTAADCPDMGFYGWYKGTYSHATTAPTGTNFYLPGATAELTAGENKFYAVYATIGAPANTYTKITTTGELTTGDYLIVYEGLYYNWTMKNAYQSSESTMSDESYALGTQITCTNAQAIWRITKSTNTITIYSENSSKYFGFTSNHVALMNASQDLSYEVSGGTWAIYAGSDYLDYSSYFQRGSSKVYKAALFKRDQTISGPYTTSPVCTTHELDVVADPVAGGTAEAEKTVLGETKTTTATATPNSHYTFSHWTISGTGATMSNTVDNKSTDNPVTVTMGTADATLTAHFTEKEKCTVVFKNNGGIESSTTYWLGENPVAPTLTDGVLNDACDATSDKHYGWTRNLITGNVADQATLDARTGSDVVYAKAATLPAITAGDNGTTITYHAVWAQAAGSGSGNYELVEEDLGTDWAGDYLIAYSSTIFADGRVGGKDAAGSIGAQSTHVTPGDNLSANEKVVAASWGDTYYVTLEEISENSNTYVLKTQDDVYNYQSSNNNGLASTDNKATAANYPITVNFESSSDIELALGGGAAGAIFHYNTSSLGSGGDVFRYYKNGGQAAIYLYKKMGGTTYSTFLTTCCDKNVTLATNSPANGTITFSPSGTISTCGADAATRQTTMTVTPNTGYYLSSWSTTGVTPASLSTDIAYGSTSNSGAQATTVTFTQNTTTGTYTANATFTAIPVSSLSLRAQQTGQSDKVGNDLTMNCYPKEGQTGGNDPLNHTLKVLFEEVLPANALDKTYDWSVRVKATGDADWTAVGFTGNALNTNSIIHTFNKSTGTLIIKATEGTAEIKITAHDGSGVNAKVTISVANVAMSSVSVSPTEMEVYAGQKKPVTVTFTPANATDRSYSAGSSYTYVNIQNKGASSFNIEGKTSVTDANHDETVTVTTTDGSKTATVDVTVKPLPKVMFVDNVHNESFANVIATVDDGGLTVTTTKPTPTHSDVSDPGASYNTCERQHLHLLGWIESTWADANPNAGNDAIKSAGAGNYYAAGADIDLVTQNNKTFYAVWTKIE